MTTAAGSSHGVLLVVTFDSVGGVRVVRVVQVSWLATLALRREPAALYLQRAFVDLHYSDGGMFALARERPHDSGEEVLVVVHSDSVLCFKVLSRPRGQNYCFFLSLSRNF